MKEKAILIISGIIFVIAFILSQQYLKSERKKLYRGAEPIDIIVASKDLPKGTVLTIRDLAKKQVFKRDLAKNEFTFDKGIDDIIDKRLIFPVSRGTPIRWNDVFLPSASKGSFSDGIKSGLRAVAISVSGDAGVDGHVKPQDRVDILGTFSFPSQTIPGEMESVTLTMLQDVTVLATGKITGKRDDIGQEVRTMRASSYSSVTLQVTPQEAELLTFAQNVRGQLKLTLRNRSDGSFMDTLPSVDFKHIEEKIPEYNEFRQRVIREKTNMSNPDRP